ncbi:MAG: hypothetical protein JNL90_15400 [Planctomycetes bacterium]|nr:hypothetical protein [Planctomycetota bacterium]
MAFHRTDRHCSLVAAFLALAAAGELRAQAHEQSSLICPYVSDSNYWSAAFAIDGDLMVVGAPNDSSYYPIGGHGAATVHQRDPVTGAWTYHQKLFASDYASFEAFGGTVAVEGDRLAIAAPRNAVNNLGDAGSVYLLERDAITGLFVEVQKLDSIAPVAGEGFGFGLSLKGDLLLVGCPGAGNGSVQVFRRDAITGLFAFEAQLIDSNGSSAAFFGRTIDFDGTTALIGAPRGIAGATSFAGTVELFSVSGTTWTQGQQLSSNAPQVNGNFGGALALDGDRIAVGAASEAVGASSLVGRAYVFVKDPITGLFGLEQRLDSPTLAYNSGFGTAVDMTGGLLVVGAPNEVTGGGHIGSAWTWRLGKKSNGPWHLESELQAGPSIAEENYGCGVRVAGSQLVVASQWANTNSGRDTGALFFYDAAEFTLTITPTQPAAGAPIDLEAHRGAAGSPILIAVEAIDGVPVFVPILTDVFASDLSWSLPIDAPDPLFGSTVSVRAWKIGAGGPLVGSQLVDLEL